MKVATVILVASLILFTVSGCALLDSFFTNPSTGEFEGSPGDTVGKVGSNWVPWAGLVISTLGNFWLNIRRKRGWAVAGSVVRGINMAKNRLDRNSKIKWKDLLAVLEAMQEESGTKKEVSKLRQS